MRELSDGCSSEAGEGRFSEPDPVHTTCSQHAHDPLVTSFTRREVRPTCHQVCSPHKGTVPKHFFNAQVTVNLPKGLATCMLQQGEAWFRLAFALKVHVRARIPLPSGFPGRGFGRSLLPPCSISLPLDGQSQNAGQKKTSRLCS